MKRDWLWDMRITERQINKILGNPEHPRFISLCSLLLLRKNTPQEVFRDYLKPQYFCRYWKEIKRRMQKDAWGSPRIEFWQAIYEKLSQKYRVKDIRAFSEGKTKPINDFCLWFGGKIKALRKQKNLTQEMLADALGISQQMISRIESGRENISLLTLKKVIDKLGARIEIVW